MSSQDDPSTLDGPLIADRYRLGRLLGEGGQGSTFLGFDRKQNCEVAIKAFAMGRAAAWKQFDLFERECKVLRNLEHPRIPRYFDELRSEDGATYYLVMQHIPGESLRVRLRRDGALSEAELWQVLWQLSDVLAYLHGRSPPVVHRDIKPHNLVRRPDGEIALVDFGGVRTALRSDGNSTVVGTFGYMAPEQLHGAATPATDMYGLGATLIALGTAMEPEHLPRQGLRIDFSEHLSVSPKLQRVLRRLVEPEPAARPASGVALQQLLETGLDEVEEVQVAAVPADTSGIPSLPEDIPPQVGVVVGVLLTAGGVLGGVLVSLLDLIFVPLVFALIAIFAGKDRKPMLTEQQHKVRGALGEAGQGLRQLTSRGVQDFRKQRALLPEHRPGRRGRGRGRFKGR
ncbi:MAG: serine/threonine-protein kinase [Pseudomonadota bacterium]